MTSPTANIFRIRVSVNSTNTDILRSVLRCRLPSIVYCLVMDTVYAPFRTVFYETVDNKSSGQCGRSINGSKLIKNGGFRSPDIVRIRISGYNIDTDILRTDLRVRLPATVYGPLTNTVYAPF